MPEIQSTILDQHGRPFKREVMDQRIAGPTSMGGRSVMTGHPAQNLSPARLGSILRAAEDGDDTAYHELAEEMEEKDLHYRAVLSKRKQAIAQLPITVVSADDSAEAKADAELVEEFLERDELQDEIVDMLDSIGRGYSVTEIIWDRGKDRWTPMTLERVDPRWLEFDRVDMATLRLKNDHGLPEDLPAYKFITHKTPGKSGTIIRSGLARAAAWHYCFKNFAWKDWLDFLERFAVPFPVGRYDNGTSPEDKDKLLYAVLDLQSRGAAIFPKSMEVEFMDGKLGTSPGDLWVALIDKCDEYLSKLVLGQTNTTDAKSGGLGSGQAAVHREVEESIERSDARRLATTLNRDLVKPLILLNRGPRKKYPKLKIGREDPVDIAAMTAAAALLVPMGVKVSAKKMRDLASLPEPEGDDDEVLVAPGQSAGSEVENQPPENRPEKGIGRSGGTQGRKRTAPALFGASLPAKSGDEVEEESAAAQSGGSDDSNDALDDLADAFLTDWEPLIDPLIDQIAAALDGAKSPADVRAALAGLADLDDSALVDALAGAGMTARLRGELDVQTEQEDG